LINTKCERQNQLIQEIIKSEKSPKQKIISLFEINFRLLEEDEDFRQIQELIYYKTAFVPELKETMQNKQIQSRMVIELIEGWIREGITINEFRQDINSRAAAISIIGAYSGLISLWVFDPNHFSIQKLTQDLIGHILKGITS